MQIDPDIYELDAARFLDLAASVYNTFENWFSLDFNTLIEDGVSLFETNEIPVFEYPITLKEMLKG